MYRMLKDKVLDVTPVATGVNRNSDGWDILDMDSNGNPIYDRSRHLSATPAGVFTLSKPIKRYGENSYHLIEGYRNNPRNS